MDDPKDNNPQHKPRIAKDPSERDRAKSRENHIISTTPKTSKRKYIEYIMVSLKEKVVLANILNIHI